MASYRSTKLKLAFRHCPRAIDFLESGMEYDRSVFATGVAAHAFLEASVRLGDGAEIFDSVARELTSTPRTFDGATEPPMDAESVYHGMDLASAWIAAHGLPPRGSIAEKTYAVDAEWNRTYDDEPYYKAALDLNFYEQRGDDRILVVRDYKSSWRDGEEVLDSLQLRGQAAVAIAHDTIGATHIRLEVANLRTLQLHQREMALDPIGMAIVRDWRRAIDLSIAAADARDPSGARWARPGAGCLGCPYLTRCEDARRVMRGSFLEQATTADAAREVATRLAVAEAMVAELTAAAKRLCGDEPVKIDGGFVGYKLQTKRTVTSAAPSILAREWFSESPEIASAVVPFLEALTFSVSSMESAVRAIVPARRGEQAYKAKREMLLDALLGRYVTTSFGVHRE